MTLLLFVQGLQSCCPIRKEYIVLPSVADCLTDPPPTLEPVIATVDESCPEHFALCLDVDAGLVWEANYRLTRRWMSEAWTRCSAPDAGADGGVVDGGF